MFAKILTQNGFVRHIPLQRELAFIFCVPDWGTVPSLMCGTPMVGHAVWAPGMMTRNKKALCTINDVIAKPKKNNLKMISQATPTGDNNLDEKAWKKTQDEIDRGIALLFTNWNDLVDMFGHDIVVAVRRAIWEGHGNAIEWAVRVIDDSRAGLINDACSCCSVHRPATHDDVIAAIMVRRQRHEFEKSNHGQVILQKPICELLKCLSNYI